MASLEQILASLQLDKYVEVFHKNEVDLDSAKLLSEKEFEELGMALGPRKKLYNYFHTPAPAAAAPTAASGSSSLAKPAAVAKPAAAGVTPLAAGKLPAPAAVKLAAPVKPAAAATLPKIANIMAWDWCFDAAKWTDQGNRCEPTRFRLGHSEEPTEILWAGCVRKGNSPFRVFNIDSGSMVYDYTPTKGDPEEWRDADWSGDTIVCCGGNVDGTLAVFDIATKKEKGVLIGKNEQHMSDVTIVTSASGAMQAAALSQGNGQSYPPMRLFDIATLSRAGKFADVYDSPISSIQPDHNNPGCFLASSHYKFFYIDARAGKAVKKFGAGAGTIHLPTNPGGVFIASDRNTNNATQVWDIGTQKALHTLQSADKRNFSSSCMYANVAVTYGPQYTGSGGQWGWNFFDLDDGVKCQHELVSTISTRQQMAMSSRIIVGMSESSEFISCIRPK